MGNSSNHVFGVEFDTLKSLEFADIDNNHVGIDINDLKSANSTTAGYYDNYNNEWFIRDISLSSGDPIQVWIEYDGVKKKIDVTLAPINVVKPTRPLLSLTKDLSPILNNIMYVGFSSATGSIRTYHDVLGWSFKVDGKVHDLIISKLPTLTRFSEKKEGEILEAKDENFGSDYVSDEVELVLKLGLLCSHSEPLARPSMRQVMQYLERDIPLPDLSLLSLSSFGLTFGYQEVVKDKTMSHISVSVTESLLSGGR
ncbi:hypothetical protein TSUD_163620 [Trifolium subterraneum]|uniref:Legume lectin domain-containing protein n=1 Tax=Trifolium subterraneum TaxID=3900 RepID=A0A2Z6P8A3_TRISU|nr:hypothetical protein TSUD_163620 [Trifolium subterraneum]